MLDTINMQHENTCCLQKKDSYDHSNQSLSARGIDWQSFRRLDDKRCDIGNKEGFVKTNIECALKDPDIAEDMKAYISRLSQTF